MNPQTVGGQREKNNKIIGYIDALNNSGASYIRGYSSSILSIAQYIQKHNIDDDVINEIIKEYYSKNGGY